MEYGFSEEQRALRQSVRDFVVREAPLSHVREMENDQLGYSRELWRKIASLNWIGLDYPEEYGGGCGDFVDVAIVAEELGRGLFPSPYVSSAVIAGHAILASDSEQHKANLLPCIARGESIISLALTEPSGSYESSAIETVAETTSRDSHALTGTKLFVPFAHVADRLIVAARTSDQPGNTDNISLFAVDPRSEGVSVSPLSIISGEKQCAVELKSVISRDCDLLGSIGSGWLFLTHALDSGKVAMSAEMVGGAQAALDLAVKYVKERPQFGVPIGTFQALQHRLADLATEIEGARWLVYEAAWKIATNGSAGGTAAMAKAFVSETYLRAAGEAVQVHGGYGFMTEYDPQLFFRRAKAAEAILGDAYHNRELVARYMGM